MKLKPLKDYYTTHLKSCLRDYDKYAFINEGKFKFYENPYSEGKCGFFLDHLIRRNGSLRLNVKNLKSRELI